MKSNFSLGNYSKRKCLHIYDSYFGVRSHLDLGEGILNPKNDISILRYSQTYEVKISSLSLSPFILHKVVCRWVRVKPLPTWRSGQAIHLKVELVTVVDACFLYCCCTAYYESTSSTLFSSLKNCLTSSGMLWRYNSTFILSYLFLVLLHSDDAGIQNKAGRSYYVRGGACSRPKMVQRFCLLKAGCHWVEPYLCGRK